MHLSNFITLDLLNTHLFYIFNNSIINSNRNIYIKIYKDLSNTKQINSLRQKDVNDQIDLSHPG